MNIIIKISKMLPYKQLLLTLPSTGTTHIYIYFEEDIDHFVFQHLSLLVSTHILMECPLYPLACSFGEMVNLALGRNAISQLLYSISVWCHVSQPCHHRHIGSHHSLLSLLSCALQDGQQHSRLLPTRSSNTSPILTTKNFSRHCQMSPGG